MGLQCCMATVVLERFLSSDIASIVSLLALSLIVMVILKDTPSLVYAGRFLQRGLHVFKTAVF